MLRLLQPRRLTRQNSDHRVESPEKVANPEPGKAARWTIAGMETGWILLLFFLLGGGSAPEVNEAHYLAKARHFWDRQFCAGDHFLQSGDGHFGFFLVCGWLPACLPFPIAAWVGRITAWTLLAWAWQRLSSALVPVTGASILSAGAWAVLIPLTQMSGEWVLGGWEAKVFAYALALLALREVVSGRWDRAGVWLGAATAMHVLVGGWLWLLVAVAWWLQGKKERGSIRRLLPWWTVGLCLAAVAVIPALQLQAGVDRATAQAANQIYVWGRLSHHLLLRAFPPELVLRHVLAIATFMTLWSMCGRTAGARGLGRIVWGAVGLAVIGALLDATLGATPTGATLLKFYWFRLSDVFVPLGIALLGLVQLSRQVERHHQLVRVASLAIGLAIGVQAFFGVREQLALSIPAGDRQGGITHPAQYRDWLDVCEWVRAHLPARATVLTPFDHQTFKWYAERAEVVTNKDVPQDARALVEWWHRLAVVRSWRECLDADESRQKLEAIVRDYQVDYVLMQQTSDTLLPSLPIIHQTPSYVLMAVPPAQAAP